LLSIARPLSTLAKAAPSLALSLCLTLVGGRPDLNSWDARRDPMFLTKLREPFEKEIAEPRVQL
jgi:hypothetical protein